MDPVIRFGGFELDARAGQLTRSGRRVHLPPQAMRVLTLLTAKAGEVVTRDEIRTALWGNDTYVDFDTAVNACVSQIRTALGDRPTAPRFVETLPRRGYRFVAPIAVPDEPPAPAAVVLHEQSVIARQSPAGPAGWTRGWILLFLVLVVAALAASTLGIQPSMRAGDYARNRSLAAVQKLERGASGLADASPSELLDRVKHFETAIAKEPDFAEAYAGLAEAKLIIAQYRAEPPQVAYPAAKAAAAKALALNPDLGQAHALYAAAVLLFDWDWNTARLHFARALTLTPGSPRVHHWYARYLTARGRHDEALRHARRAVALAPTSPSAVTNAGITAFYAGRLQEATAQCARAAALMPEFVPAQTCLAGTAAAREGRPGASPDGMLAPAVSLASAGERDRALDWLQLAANRHSDGLIFAAVQPAFGPLQGDARFTSILERVGLRGPANPAY